MRRTLPVILTLVAGTLAILNSYIIFEPLNNWVPNYLQRTVTISTAWAVGIGSLNLMRIHSARISRKTTNWSFSVILIVAFTFFLVLGFVLEKHQENPFYSMLWNYVQPPLSSTMYSILAFYMASAAFRAFRMHSVDSTLMLLSAFIVMLGAVPIGEMIWPGFPVLQEWLLNYINTSSQRAITIGLTLGAMAQSMRVMVGLERGHLSGGE